MAKGPVNTRQGIERGCATSMGVIDGAPRSASEVAVEPTICTAYRSDEFLNPLQ